MAGAALGKAKMEASVTACWPFRSRCWCPTLRCGRRVRPLEQELRDRLAYLVDLTSDS